MKASSITSYFQGVVTEMRKVVWPSFPVLLRYFISVVAGILLATAFVGGVDYVFHQVLSFIIK